MPKTTAVKKSAGQTEAAHTIAEVPARSKDAVRISAVARQIRKQVNESLRSQLESFAENAALEEQRFMIEVMREWDGRSGMGSPRRISDHEVPLYGAIQRQLDDCLCVVVPRDEMVDRVNEFINALDKEPIRPKTRQPVTEDDITARLERQFRAEFELFARDAKQPSLRLMLGILARWNEIANDPGMNTLPNTLAVAAEMELDALRAKIAAKGEVG